MLLARLVLLLLVTIAGCSSNQSADAAHELPAIPEVTVADFALPVQRQIMNAYAQVQANPLDAETNAELGRILHAYKLLPWAVRCYQRARRLAPNDFATAYYLGIANMQAGADAAAVVNLRDALRLAPGYAPARLRLAELLFKTGALDEARTLLETLLQRNPDSPWAHHELAQVLTAQGRPQAAIAHNLDAVELFGKFASAHYALAMAYRDRGETERAAWHLARYRQYPQSAPPHVDALLEGLFERDISASAQIRRARRLDAAGRHAEAVEALERAVAMEPHSIEAHSQLIRLYAALNDFDRAQEHYEAVTSVEPNAVMARLWFGEFLARREQLAEAAALFTAVLQTKPDHAMAHTLLGQTLEEMHQPLDAERHYRLALASDPRNRQARFLLGRYLARAGRVDEARALQEGAPNADDRNHHAKR
jgi:tetratricopeptide (TPR) repeat protein